MSDINKSALLEWLTTESNDKNWSSEARSGIGYVIKMVNTGKLDVQVSSLITTIESLQGELNTVCGKLMDAEETIDKWDNLLTERGSQLESQKEETDKLQKENKYLLDCKGVTDSLQEIAMPKIRQIFNCRACGYPTSDGSNMISCGCDDL